MGYLGLPPRDDIVAVQSTQLTFSTVFTFAVSIDCFRITAHTSCRSSLCRQFYAISGWMRLIKNATVVVGAGAENNHAPHNHGTVVLSGLAFQTPLNVITEIVNAIVGVEGVGGWAGGAKEWVSYTR